MNSEAFLADVKQMLGPELKPGNVVVMDNFPASGGKGVGAAIREAGASLMYLPAYIPNLNPLNEMLAKLKAHLRKIKARSTMHWPMKIGKLIQSFRSTNAATSSKAAAMRANNRKKIQVAASAADGETETGGTDDEHC